MLNKLRKIERWKDIDSDEINPLIDRINTLSKITASNGIRIATSPLGINLIGSGITGGVRQPRKIFEVRSAATGDGVYNCYEQVLDSTDWTDTAGVNKFNDRYSAWVIDTDYIAGDHVINDNVQYKCILAHTSAAADEPGTGGNWETYWTVEAEVLNLLESNAVADYTPALFMYDKIDAWQIEDDEQKTCWVGIPVEPSLRIVCTVDSAPSTQVYLTTITCDAWLEGKGAAGAVAVDGELGYHIEVHGFSAPLISNWDDVFPVIVEGYYYHAYCKCGKWYFTDMFMTNIACTCVVP